MKRIRYAGLAEESTLAPDPLPEAAQHLDIASASLDSPSEPRMIYDGGMGRSRRTPRPGFYSPSGDLAYAVDVQSIHRILKWTLGSYLFTADAPEVDTNRHEAYGGEEILLPSFTARVGKDLFEHVFAGCVVDQLQLEVSNEFVVATATIQAVRDSKATLKQVTELTLPEAYPLSFVDTNVSLGGSDASAKVRSATITIQNNLQADLGRRMGSRFPREIPAAARNIDVQLNVVFDSTDHLETFWGEADEPAESGAGMTSATVTLDAGEDGQVELDMPSIQYAAVDLQPQGRAEIEQQITANAFADEITLEDDSTVNAELVARIDNDQDEVTA